jgi:tubulin polyglutamylase TTLL9
VLSYNPLKVYLYREGFARFTAARYSNDDISNNFIHLTNHAIQKKDGDYDPTTTDLKWPVGQLKRVILIIGALEKETLKAGLRC